MQIKQTNKTGLVRFHFSQFIFMDLHRERLGEGGARRERE